MNKNIEKINEHLWLVNFDHVDAGYIKELKGVTLHDGYKAHTSEGILLLNSKYDDMIGLSELYELAMTLDEKELRPNQAFKHLIAMKKKNNILNWNDKDVETYVAYHHFGELRNMMNNISITEIDRRYFLKKYKGKAPFRAFKKLIGRK